jgi:hypothetical protein
MNTVCRLAPTLLCFLSAAFTGCADAAQGEAGDDDEGLDARAQALI